MDEKLTSAIEDFITARVNDYGADAPDEVTDAIRNVMKIADALVATLTPEQRALWLKLENALSLQTGEENRYYYKAGLSDALRLLGRRGV